MVVVVVVVVAVAVAVAVEIVVVVAVVVVGVVVVVVGVVVVIVAVAAGAARAVGWNLARLPRSLAMPRLVLHVLIWRFGADGCVSQGAPPFKAKLQLFGCG